MNDLVVRVGAQSYTFAPGETVRIGRNPGSDILVENSNVSREHAVITHDHGTWLIRDAGSSQGTWRDGERITELELRGTIRVTLGREDRGTSIVIEAPTAVAQGTARPGGAMAEAELDASTEIVGSPRGPRGRMDETVIVNAGAPEQPVPAETNSGVGDPGDHAGATDSGAEPATPAKTKVPNWVWLIGAVAVVLMMVMVLAALIGAFVLLRS